LKSHIPSSAVADATEPITHTTASGVSFLEIWEAVSIAQHKMLTVVPQLVLPGDQAGKRARIGLIKQLAWNLGRTVPFACQQTTECRDDSERCNEEDDENNLDES
jgi:hypothetical protein